MLYSILAFGLFMGKGGGGFDGYLAKFMVMSTPQMELSDRIHKMEEQIPAIEKYHEFVAYHKKYTSLEGKAKTKYKSDFCYELDEYHKAYKKLIELFPDAHIPKLSKLKTELEKARTDYAQQSAERKALKKEADRLSRLAQQKRDSQRTLARYMQNEQAAKRKVSLNKKIRQGDYSPCRGDECSY